MVELVEKTKEEWQKEYENYPSVTPEGYETFYQSRVLPIAYEIPLGSKVLDVGANDGEFMKLLKEKRDCDVYGIDVSDVAIAKAKDKGFDVIKADGETLPFEDASFDVVVLMEVLNHLHDPSKVLKEIRRVLKAGGYLLGSVPHANLERFIWNDKRLHKRNLEEPELQDILETQFPTVYIRTLKGGQFAVSFVNSFLQDKPCEMLFKCGSVGLDNWESELQSNEKPRVWFGPTQLGGTIYYRMLGFAEKMEKAGLIQAAYERAPWDRMDESARNWQARIRNRVVLNQLDQILRVADMSIWQITISRDVLAFLNCAKDLANGEWYKATGKRKFFLTDIDDNLFDIPPGNIASHPYTPNSDAEWIASKQIELSDALICSTEFLRDKIHSIFADKPIHLIPNSIDFDIWDHLTPDTDLPKKEEGIIRIGYTGCSNHRQDLELIKEPLCAILKEFPNVQFLFTPQPDEAGTFCGWDGIPNMGVVQKWAPIDKFPNFVAGWNCDIFIAPLKDNEFNRAKSNLRWLEASALKRPCVASRVYPFKNSIRDGEDGVICNTSRQWYEDLKSLILDAQKRKMIGETAYQRVKRDFNMDTIAIRYAAILEEIRCSDPISSQKSAVS